MTDSKDDQARPSGIRVVDRRAFTPAGEVRTPDIPPDEHPPAQKGPSPAAEGATGRPAAPRPGPSTAPSAQDQKASAHFQSLVLNLARQAAASLGAAKDPFTGQVEIDIDGAEQIIDLLQALRVKTCGNLTAEETAMLEGLIGDLQMQFVTVRSRTSKTS